MLIKLKIYLIFFLLISSEISSKQAISLEYGIFAKGSAKKPISKVFVIGERCSGTNFIQSLILKNTHLTFYPIGHKHFPPWYSLGKDHYQGNPQYFNFNDTEDCLFVIIFRDPYDWVRSLHLQPYHAKISFWRIPFDEFIRREWNYDPDDIVMKPEFAINPYVDVNPKDGLPFKNVLALRTAKIRNMLEIKKRAVNVYHINYETVRDRPKEVLNEIASLYHLELNIPFSPIFEYQGGHKETEYKQKKYNPISQIDLDYINSQLDRRLEKKIGYKLKENNE